MQGGSSPAFFFCAAQIHFSHDIDASRRCLFHTSKIGLFQKALHSKNGDVHRANTPMHEDILL
jgi:hypothetical protein